MSHYVSTKANTTIYYGCPDYNVPTGGIKQIYRHVETLRNHGFSAFVVHQTENFQCTWFEHKAPICYRPTFTTNDFLVLPEGATGFVRTTPGVRKIIFNQNSYLTFNHISVEKILNVNCQEELYYHPEVLGAIVVSEDNRNYLKYAFPNLDVYRVRNGINLTKFRYRPEAKKRIISFMPRKNSQDSIQVVNILKNRGSIATWSIIPIEQKTETEVSEILRESTIFLGFGYPEGLPLPPLEAMACGCIVIGYHGMGGREYFRPEFCYPIAHGDIIAFTNAVEEVIKTEETNLELLRHKMSLAYQHIIQNYSLDHEVHDIVEVWNKIINHT